MCQQLESGRQAASPSSKKLVTWRIDRGLRYDIPVIPVEPFRSPDNLIPLQPVHLPDDVEQRIVCHPYPPAWLSIHGRKLADG
jgi:hypothetical protein